MHNKVITWLIILLTEDISNITKVFDQHKKSSDLVLFFSIDSILPRQKILDILNCEDLHQINIEIILI